jgi:adenine-specific DNA methylase
MLKEDPAIKELCDEDVAVYIDSWGVKCLSWGLILSEAILIYGKAVYGHIQS